MLEGVGTWWNVAEAKAGVQRNTHDNGPGTRNTGETRVTRTRSCPQSATAAVCAPTSADSATTKLWWQRRKGSGGSGRKRKKAGSGGGCPAGARGRLGGAKGRFPGARVVWGAQLTPKRRFCVPNSPPSPTVLYPGFTLFFPFVPPHASGTLFSPTSTSGYGFLFLATEDGKKLTKPTLGTATEGRKGPLERWKKALGTPGRPRVEDPA